MNSDAVTAIATSFAAIAAVGSVVSAIHQETATYQSQLYNRQIDSLATLANDAGEDLRDAEKIIAELRCIDNGRACDHGKQLVDALTLEAKLKHSLDKFELVFPLEKFSPLRGKLEEAISNPKSLIASLDNGETPHTKYATPVEAFDHYTRSTVMIARCIESEYLKKMIECAKQQFRQGKGVGEQDAEECLKSLRASQLQNESSDSHECYTST